jgi:hypothetical protein
MEESSTQQSNRMFLNTWTWIHKSFPFEFGGIAAITKQSLAGFNLDVRNVQGIGTDNASVMVGINNVSIKC